MIAKKNKGFKIVPYLPEHEQELLQIERLSSQGFMVKLETVRSRFLSRAELFEDHTAFVAVDPNNKVLAGVTAAAAPVRINGELQATGFGFDVIVDPSMRNRGIGRELATCLRKRFFEPKGLMSQFTTLRAGNLTMLHLISKSYRNTFLYEFLYLTFPTARVMRVEDTALGAPAFGVSLFSDADKLSQYYEVTENGIGLWHTHQVYQLKVKSVNPVLSGGLWLGNRFVRTNKYVPLVGSTLKTTTIFNLTLENIHTLPDVSLQLYKQGINYMQICCQPNDAIYHALQKSALNAFSHYIVSTQQLDPEVPLTLDVRCL
ncbi:GNAT family N-acetyltransferase [Pontibacter ramchanderi]|uniref:Acetyltransferase (GNAT) family protein n=1 Tax=Pontibacter ramchanderi TaxID=1179743 RepID=A0A2N3V0P5_9BACT|nr:GNAT family N-acetyltransferase [Pontibacter ramchanderi]PKV75194.1 acetyltransferase (GNAT) family protein [Pontibacter ramchanderi]